jgi:hypothetical protein
VLQAGSTGNRKRRLQFLLTMGLAWAVIGSLIATMMSSVGPCYFGLTYSGPDPFAEHVAYLRGVAASVGETVRLPFTTTVLQDMLWKSYATNDFGMVRGISAAPSMHIASTWIIARLAWDMGKAARIAGCAFLGFIFIGSIHLGWHYAIDGYMAMALAWTLWRSVGWLLNRPMVQAFLWPSPRQSARCRPRSTSPHPCRGALRLARQHRRLVGREQPGFLLIALYLIGADRCRPGSARRTARSTAWLRYEGYIADLRRDAAVAFILYILHLSLVRKISIQTSEAGAWSAPSSFARTHLWRCRSLPSGRCWRAPSRW